MAVAFDHYKTVMQEKHAKEFLQNVERIRATVEAGFDESIKRGEHRIIFAYPTNDISFDSRLFDEVAKLLTITYKSHGWGGVKVDGLKTSHVVFALNLPGYGERFSHHN